MSSESNKDVNGKESHKRINSTRLIWLGMAMAVITWGIGLVHAVPSPGLCRDIVLGVIAIGGGISISTIFEKYAGRNKS